MVSDSCELPIQAPQGRDRRQPMKRTMDSATAAGFSDPSISTVVLRVACTAAVELGHCGDRARARSLAPTRTGVMKRTLL